MGGRDMDGIEENVATAFGMYALTDAKLHEAARKAGITRWELEDAIERAGLAETFGLAPEAEVTETIDDLLEEF